MAGVSLGLFFGGVAFAALLVPPLTAAETSVGKRILIPICATAGTAAVWLTALGERLTVPQWFACAAALLAYAVALAGICSLLLALRFHPAIAAAAVTALGMFWLTWPVWLSAALRSPSGDAIVAWLIPAHPLAAINAALAHFDTWDRYPLAYSRLTVLNQDVFYALPRGVGWTVVLHSLLGAAAFSIAHWMEVRRRRACPTTSPAAAAPSSTAAT